MAIITISRQAGSLGDEIARGLAREMDYKLIGRQDFQGLAERYDPDFAKRLKRIDEERGLGFFERLFYSTPIYLSLYEALIFELASQRRVIILGRGAQIVLRDVHQVYRIRVVAPTHLRIVHLRQVHGMSTDEAVEFIHRHDQQRRNLVRQIYDHDPRDWGLYDMILNTARLDVQAGIEIIKSALNQVMRLQPLEEATKVLQGLALGKRVEAKVRQEVLPTRDVEVLGESGGKVTLVGSLPSVEDRERAEKVARTYPGVSEVVNQIKTAVLVLGY